MYDFCKVHFTKSSISSLTAITKSKIIAIFAQKYQNNTILLFHKGGKPCSVSFCYYNKLDLLCSNYINLHKAHEIGH